MKNKNRILFASLITVAFATGLAHAQQDGTWSADANGNWNSATNPPWAGGTPADGSGFTAFFNAVDLTADRTVTLGVDRTIGNLDFADTVTSSAAGWLVTGDTLTLAGGTPTITVGTLGTGKVATIASTLDGTSGFTKAGAGTLTLSGANTYTGGTTVSAGLLRFQDSSAGAANYAANANSTLEFNVTTGSRKINGGSLTGAGTFVKSGAGQLLIGSQGSAQNVSLSSGGLIDVQGGLLRNEFALGLWGSNLADLNVDSGAYFDLWDGNVRVDAITGTGTINKGWNTNQTLTFGVDNGSGTFSGTISSTNAPVGGGYTGSSGGTFGLTKQGTGTQTLSGTNTYTGTTTISGGVLRITNGAALGSTAAGTTANGTALEIDGSGGAVVVGAEALSISGGGTSNLGALRNIAGNNTYGGAVTLTNITRFMSDSGTLTLDNPSAVTASGAGQNLILGGTGNFTISGAITTGTGFIQKEGAGSLTLSGANTYTGVTILAGGVLNVASLPNYGVAGSLGNRASDSGGGNVGILFRGGTLQYTGSTAQSTDRAIRINANGGGGNAGGATIDASGSNPAATLSFTAASSPDFFEFGGTRTLTLTGNNTGDNTFAINIPETGGATSVTKTGAGKWVLTGNNSYTGNTTVNEGTLALVGGSQASAITVNSGAALGFTLGSPTTSTSTVTFSGATAKVTVSGTPAAATLLTTTVSGGITGTPVLDPAIPGFALQVTATQLNLVASGTTYDTWVALYQPGFTLNLPSEDQDGDGLTNQQEFAFGLNPTSGSSVNPITTGLAPATGNFSYTRNVNSGLTYKVWSSTDLAVWTERTGATQTLVGTADSLGTQTVNVTTLGATPVGGKLFVRVTAE